MTKTHMQSMFLWFDILKSKPTTVASLINELSASLAKYVYVYQKAVLFEKSLASNTSFATNSSSVNVIMLGKTTNVVIEVVE